MFHTKGNEAADNVLFTLECLDVISAEFKRRISNVVLVTLTNIENNDIPKLINETNEMLKITRIFSEDFRDNKLAS